MHLPSLFVLLVYVAGYVFLLFAAICLACGLYYLVELTEEYTMLTKRITRVVIQVHVVLHVLLYAYERFPLFPCVVGLVSHLVYWQLLLNFPFMQPTSLPFLSSVCAFIVDNYVWYRFFKSDFEIFYRYQVAPLPATAAFFLLVIWLVPSIFFCALTVNDAVLPSATMAQRQDRKRTNMVMATLDRVSMFVKSILGGGNPGVKSKIGDNRSVNLGNDLNHANFSMPVPSSNMRVSHPPPPHSTPPFSQSHSHPHPTQHQHQQIFLN